MNSLLASGKAENVARLLAWIRSRGLERRDAGLVALLEYVLRPEEP